MRDTDFRKDLLVQKRMQPHSFAILLACMLCHFAFVASKLEPKECEGVFADACVLSFALVSVSFFLSIFLLLSFLLCLVCFSPICVSVRIVPVCIRVLRHFSDVSTKLTSAEIEKKMKAWCKKSDGADRRFCYYIGMWSTYSIWSSAAFRLSFLRYSFSFVLCFLCRRVGGFCNECVELGFKTTELWQTVRSCILLFSSPAVLSVFFSVEKICEEIRSKDAQICEIHDVKDRAPGICSLSLHLCSCILSLSCWMSLLSGNADQAEEARRIIPSSPSYSPSFFNEEVEVPGMSAEEAEHDRPPPIEKKPKSNLASLRISELRRIVEENALNCDFCSEKSDYIEVIEQFRRTHPDVDVWDGCAWVTTNLINLAHACLLRAFLQSYHSSVWLLCMHLYVSRHAYSVSVLLECRLECAGNVDSGWCVRHSGRWWRARVRRRLRNCAARY